MTQARDEGLREMIALAAVGALDADERAALDAQLVTRADLREEMAEMELAVAALAEATALAPPLSLRATVLDAVRDVPQEPGPLAAPTAVVTTREERRATPVTSMVGRRRRRSAVLAAGVAMAAALIGVVVVQTGRSDGVEMADVVDASDAVSVELTGELQGLHVVRSPDAGAIALVGDGVVPPRDDQVYELWLIEDAPARVDVFRPDDDGRVALVVDGMDPPAEPVWAVTVEPAGGSSSPTGPVVAMTPPP